jgi:hypothetical protein
MIGMIGPVHIPCMKREDIRLLVAAMLLLVLLALYSDLNPGPHYGELMAHPETMGLPAPE